MLWLILSACQSPSSDDVLIARSPGERAPLTATCDALDPTRCLLPWPSNTFTVADDRTETGLRLAIEADALSTDDDPAPLNLADGFSRITGVATGFSTRLDAATASGALRVYVAQPDDPQYGVAWPLWVEVVVGGSSLTPQDLLIGRPAGALPAGADCVAVVLDELTDADGVPLQADHRTAVLLGLADPDDDDEAALAAYHAPTRQLLADVGVAPEHVVRVWDFTTRSASDLTRRLDALVAARQDALASGALSIVMDEVSPGWTSSMALIAQGRITGVPSAEGEDGRLVLDDDGRPVTVGTRDAPFRVVIPSGEGDWPVILYGHGMGGDVSDASFDATMTDNGGGKVGLEWQGWTSADMMENLLLLPKAMLAGTERSTSGLLESLADARLVLEALDGPLGDALAADTVGGVDNPAAGRWPDTSEPVYVGGSLGGTMGAVYAMSEPRVRYAALNVPGAGWSHMIPGSDLYAIMEGFVQATYGDEVDVTLALLMAQGVWDEVDGAAWADEARDDGDMFLLQESIGDPILPNLGTAILAAALDAVQLDPAIEDVRGLSHTDGPVTDGMVLEQFRVPDTGVYDVHGFADRDTEAGRAARDQIFGFLMGALDGAPVIAHPERCDATADGSCDWGDADW